MTVRKRWLSIGAFLMYLLGSVLTSYVESNGNFNPVLSVTEAINK